MEIMKFIMSYHENAIKEKIQFYHNYVIQPLKLKQVYLISKSIKLNLKIVHMLFLFPLGVI